MSGIGNDIARHKLSSGSGGEYAKAGQFRNCPIVSVAKVQGTEDELWNYVLNFEVGSYTPGKDKDGNRYAPDTHAPGDLVKWHTKVKTKFRATYLNNIKLACLGILRQLAADAGQDPNEIKEEKITGEVVDDLIFGNESRVVGVVMDFIVTETKTKNATDGKHGTVTKFEWLVRKGDTVLASGSDEVEDEDEDAGAPAPSPAKGPVKGSKKA